MKGLTVMPTMATNAIANLGAIENAFHYLSWERGFQPRSFNFAAGL
jgi:hypothetical protein